ncbi:hypothetical protein ACN92M_07725 [Paenibacillus polymyxa]|nr:hypothetical protein [Paenibacillus polymyxa]
MKRLIKGLFATTFLLVLIASTQTINLQDLGMPQAVSNGGFSVFGWHIGS